jgi:hemoglobin
MSTQSIKERQMRSLTKALLLLSVGAFACTPRADESVDSAATAAAAAMTPTLHERLGGTAAITMVVDSFVANVAADNRINRHFQRIAGDTAAVRGFKTKLVDQICQATGGPCTYTGLDMKSAHQGMNLTDADFDALVEDLVRALDSAGVSQRDKDELLAILGPMRADIVTRR